MDIFEKNNSADGIGKKLRYFFSLIFDGSSNTSAEREFEKNLKPIRIKANKHL